MKHLDWISTEIKPYTLGSPQHLLILTWLSKSILCWNTWEKFNSATKGCHLSVESFQLIAWTVHLHMQDKTFLMKLNNVIEVQVRKNCLFFLYMFLLWMSCRWLLKNETMSATFSIPVVWFAVFGWHECNPETLYQKYPSPVSEHGDLARQAPLGYVVGSHGCHLWCSLQEGHTGGKQNDEIMAVPSYEVTKVQTSVLFQGNKYLRWNTLVF